MSKITDNDYTHLQSSIDKVVGKIGLQKTIHLLDTFISNTSIKNSEQEKIKMLTHYLVGIACKVCDLKEDLFFLSNVREYRDARMCCFHLLRKYTGDTFPKIGLAFQCSERSVEYGYAKAEERLDFPKGNVRFASNYSAIESKLLEFLGKLN